MSYAMPAVGTILKGRKSSRSISGSSVLRFIRHSSTMIVATWAMVRKCSGDAPRWAWDGPIVIGIYGGVFYELDAAGVFGGRWGSGGCGGAIAGRLGAGG